MLCVRYQALDRIRLEPWRFRAAVGVIGFALPLIFGWAVRAQSLLPVDGSTVQHYPQSMQVTSQSTLSETEKRTTPELNYTAKFNAADVAQPTNGLLQGFAAPLSNWQRNNV